MHYRDLDAVERRLAEAREGSFEIERLMFHLAGIPTYILVAELAVNRVLRGRLPQSRYPAALSQRAYDRWSSEVGMTLSYARKAHADKGHVSDCVGAVAVASCQTAHAVLAARREWVTNEKTLIDRAGLREVDRILATATPDRLTRLIDDASALFTAALDANQPVADE